MHVGEAGVVGAASFVDLGVFEENEAATLSHSVWRVLSCRFVLSLTGVCSVASISESQKRMDAPTHSRLRSDSSDPVTAHIHQLQRTYSSTSLLPNSVHNSNVNSAAHSFSLK